MAIQSTRRYQWSMAAKPEALANLRCECMKAVGCRPIRVAA